MTRNNCLVCLSKTIRADMSRTSVLDGFSMRCPCCGGRLQLRCGAEGAMHVECDGNCAREDILAGLGLEPKQVPELPRGTESKPDIVYCVHDDLEALGLLAMGKKVLRWDFADVRQMDEEAAYVVVHRASEPQWAERTVRDLLDAGYQAFPLEILRGEELAKAQNRPKGGENRLVNLSTLVRADLEIAKKQTNQAFNGILDAIRNRCPQTSLFWTPLPADR